MVVERPQPSRERTENTAGSPGMALAALAEAGSALARGDVPQEVLDAIARAAALAAAADVVVVRVVERREALLVARAVHAPSAALAAELVGTRFPLAELPQQEVTRLGDLPAECRRAAERAAARTALQIPFAGPESPLGSLELYREAAPFSREERAAARVAATLLGATVRFLEHGDEAADGEADGLELAGEALAAAYDVDRVGAQIARLAARSAGARGARLWRGGETLSCVAAFGTVAAPVPHEAIERALRQRQVAAVEQIEHEAATSAVVQVGRPPLGALELLFEPGSAPTQASLARLSTLCVRGAQAMRSTERAHVAAVELERTRALLAVVGQAIAQLSLSHTLETAVERVAELLGADRVAIYLRDEEGRLPVAAGRGLLGPHRLVAERLLAHALEPFRSRGVLHVRDAATSPLLAEVAGAVAESRIEAAIAVPLVVVDEVIGLLAVYPGAGRGLTANEAALLSALALQLGVAVENARLHERTKLLGVELEQALASERQAARQLGALYEISRSFAQTLSLDTTLEAVARTVVELLDVDVAVMLMPDARRESLEPRAIHVGDGRLREAVATMLGRPLPFSARPLQRLFRRGDPIVLDTTIARQLGDAHVSLLPFLEKGWTGAIVPVATSAEVIAALCLLSLRPDRQISAGTIDEALALAGQAALAIDNARLYQGQKEFYDTMQRSLLPRSRPRLRGLELGEVYESSARVDVGGDVYDYLVLPDGRLAVVLGDVTGHGIEAAADMAMAKFVFRSLAREHPEPGDFLTSVNEVVVGEIGAGKFITMLYLTIDPATGELAAASAGHPEPRLVLPDGAVRPIEARGLVLGVAEAQEYPEVRAELPPGGALVMFTDGVIEARREGEVYGLERLDALLARRAGLSAKELALAVVADCRSFSGGELADDCAVVVIRRPA